jgi:Uri superfamily endonuclease
MQATGTLIEAVPAKQPTVRAASNHTRGVHTFYVGSECKAGTEYAVQHVRRNRQRRWYCNCPDFLYRRLAERRHCKHIQLLAWMARLAHGVSKLAALGVREEAA